MRRLLALFISAIALSGCNHSSLLEPVESAEQRPEPCWSPAVRDLRSICPYVIEEPVRDFPSKRLKREL